MLLAGRNQKQKEPRQNEELRRKHSFAQEKSLLINAVCWLVEINVQERELVLEMQSLESDTMAVVPGSTSILLVLFGGHTGCAQS